MVFVISTIGLLVFTAALQGYFFTRNRWYEAAALVLIAFTLFRPGFWMDMLFPPFKSVAPAELTEVVGKMEPGQELRLEIDGIDEVGEPRSFVAVLPIPEGADGAARLANAGLEFVEMDGEVVVVTTGFDSIAERAGLSFDQKITGLLVPRSQLPKEMMFIPALALLALIVWLQRRRGPQEVKGVSHPIET
jgi:hypothetical protein